MQTGSRGQALSSVNQAVEWLTRHWLLAVNLAMGLFIGGTILPPVLMQVGWEGPARILYALYGLNCHQLPERSYFLFGPDGINTYSLDQILAWGADSHNLRRFVGSSEVGFKLGMAQRNTAIFGTFLLAGLTYGMVRRRVSGLRWPVFVLLALPMVLDGGSHMVSEVTGLAFREANGWLAALTGQAFGETFYSGTVAGSFNWLMRTLTGALFAIGCVGFGYPYLQRGFAGSTHRTTDRRIAPEPARKPGATARY